MTSWQPPWHRPTSSSACQPSFPAPPCTSMLCAADFTYRIPRFPHLYSLFLGIAPTLEALWTFIGLIREARYPKLAINDGMEWTGWQLGSGWLKQNSTSVGPLSPTCLVLRHPSRGISGIRLCCEKFWAPLVRSPRVVVPIFQVVVPVFRS